MRHNTKYLFSFLVLGLFLSLSYVQPTAETAENPTETNLISDKAKESTVRIVGLGMRKSEVMMGGGTGFFIAPDKIATNFHVAANCTTGLITAKLSHKETIWLAEGVVAFDIEYDIAILKVKGKGVPLPLGDSDMLQIGDPVFLVGFPSPERRYMITEGVIEKIRKNDKKFHTTAEVYPGNSGSPVLNSKGEVIGIHYGHDPGNSPVNAIKALLAGATSTESFTQWRKRKVVRAHFYFREGRDKFYDGNLEGAIDDFNQVIELNPNHAETYKMRADTKGQLGNYKGAIDDYNHTLKLNPNDTEIYKKRADAKKKLGDKASQKDDYTHTDVKVEITKTTKLNPNELGHKKLANGDYADAVEDFTQAIKLKPNDAYAYNNRGLAKIHSGDHAGAIEDFTQAIKLKPNDTLAYNNRGLAKEGHGDITGAIADYNQAIEINPKDFVAYIYRGRTKVKLKDYTGAIADYNQAIKINPKDFVAYYNRGHTKAELKDYAGAIADYDKTMELNPKSADAHLYNNRGYVKAKLEDYVGAIADYDKSVDLDPKYAIAYHNRGLAKEALGQQETAKIDFEKAKELEFAQ